MLDDPGEGGARLRAAIDALLPYADALWEPVAGEPEAIAAGVVTAGSAELRGPVADRRRGGDRAASTGTRCGALTSTPAPHAASTSTPSTQRITEVLRIDPVARW